MLWVKGVLVLLKQIHYSWCECQWKIYRQRHNWADADIFVETEDTQDLKLEAFTLLFCIIMLSKPKDCTAMFSLIMYTALEV